jgi:hypothetical protein
MGNFVQRNLPIAKFPQGKGISMPLALRVFAVGLSSNVVDSRMNQAASFWMPSS